MKIKCLNPKEARFEIDVPLGPQKKSGGYPSRR